MHAVRNNKAKRNGLNDIVPLDAEKNNCFNSSTQITAQASTKCQSYSCCMTEILRLATGPRRLQ